MTDEDLETLNEFIALYPTWWWKIGWCDYTRDFDCAPQGNSPEMMRPDATPGSIWDEGFSFDSLGTISDAIRNVMKQIKAAL